MGHTEIDVNDFLDMKNEEILKENNGKKFDIVLMNPPYDRDLHIDFIRKCIDVCDTLINISPGGFINNIGMYSTKKKSHDIIKHLKDVEFLSVEDSNKYFGLGKNGIKSELHIGVYEHDYTDGKPQLDEDVLNVYKKIRYTCKTNLRNHFINKEKFGKYGVRIFRMHYDRSTPYYDNIICTQGKAVEGIDFKTENEKNNFIKSIHTWVYEFMFKLEDTNPAHLPYLDDYTEEWTDERLYKLFDITEDDKKVIKRICGEILKENNGKKFDILLSNPPFNLGVRFFQKYFEIADKIITIQPIMWLFGKKQNKRIINKIKDTYCDITIVNPKDFDAGFLSKISINYVDYTKDKDIILHNELNDKKYKYENIEDISELSLDELLSKFNDIVKSLYENDNLQNHSYLTWKQDVKEKLIKDDLYLVRYSGIRGHGVDKENNLNPDFYTIISNNKKEQQEKVLLTTNDLKDENRKANFVFAFKSKDEQLNLLNYLQTDFCRACLATIKNNQHLDQGELKRIPWFDFSDDHFSKTPKEIDDWLFNKYDIADKIRKHIEKILPDYYGIRK